MTKMSFADSIALDMKKALDANKPLFARYAKEEECSEESSSMDARDSGGEAGGKGLYPTAPAYDKGNAKDSASDESSSMDARDSGGEAGGKGLYPAAPAYDKGNADDNANAASQAEIAKMLEDAQKMGKNVQQMAADIVSHISQHPNLDAAMQQKADDNEHFGSGEHQSDLSAYPDSHSADDTQMADALDKAASYLLTASAMLDQVGLEKSASLSLRIASFVVEAKKKKMEKSKAKKDSKSSGKKSDSKSSKSDKNDARAKKKKDEKSSKSDSKSSKSDSKSSKKSK